MRSSSFWKNGAKKSFIDENSPCSSQFILKLGGYVLGLIETDCVLQFKNFLFVSVLSILPPVNLIQIVFLTSFTYICEFIIKSQVESNLASEISLNYRMPKQACGMAYISDEGCIFACNLNPATYFFPRFEISNQKYPFCISNYISHDPSSRCNSRVFFFLESHHLPQIASAVVLFPTLSEGLYSHLYYQIGA